jgi:hypothetical protein
MALNFLSLLNQGAKIPPPIPLLIRQLFPFLYYLAGRKLGKNYPTQQSTEYYSLSNDLPV